MEPLLAILLGSIMGTALGLVGTGGAILAVPALVYLFNYPPLEATTASLVIVIAAAIVSARARAKAGQIAYRKAFILWSIGIIGNAIGSIVPDKLNTGGRESTRAGSTTIKEESGCIGLSGSSTGRNGMSGSCKGSMFPGSVGTYFILYKHPGGIPIKGSGSGSPGIFPGEVEVDTYCLS